MGSYYLTKHSKSLNPKKKKKRYLTFYKSLLPVYNIERHLIWLILRSPLHEDAIFEAINPIFMLQKHTEPMHDP